VNDSLSLVAAAVGITVGLLTLLGAAVKWVLLPYIQRELVDPIQQTHHQVTVNHHSSETPTILDRLDDVQDEIRSVRSDLSSHLLNAERAQSDGHAEARQMWSAIEAIAKTDPPKE
jgi:hypothetical protein